MADISLKVRAQALGKSLKDLAPRVEAELNQAVANLAHAAYSAMVSKVQSSAMSDKSKMDYLKGLKFQNLGHDSYLIYLDGEWADKLENGSGPYSLREVLLKSQKIVQVGSRAGQPWVQKNAEGGKYAHVPFEHKMNKAPTGDLSKDIKGLMAKGKNGKVQPISEVFKGLDGTPMSGKVATVLAADAPTPNLAGLTKYQHISKSGRVSSVYMTYRTISEHGKDWLHPGLKGQLIFQEVEAIVEAEMDNIIKTILR